MIAPVPLGWCFLVRLEHYRFCETRRLRVRADVMAGPARPHAPQPRGDEHGRTLSSAAERQPPTTGTNPAMNKIMARRAATPCLQPCAYSRSHRTLSLEAGEYSVLVLVEGHRHPPRAAPWRDARRRDARWSPSHARDRQQPRLRFRGASSPREHVDFRRWQAVWHPPSSAGRADHEAHLAERSVGGPDRSARHGDHQAHPSRSWSYRSSP